MPKTFDYDFGWADVGAQKPRAFPAEVASIARRAVAALVDGLLFSMPCLLLCVFGTIQIAPLYFHHLVIPNAISSLIAASIDFDTGAMWTAIETACVETSLLIPGTVMLWIAVCALYHALFESRWGATPGKRMLSIRITSASGALLSFRGAFARHLLSWVSVALFGIGYLLALIDCRRRTLHDRLAGAILTKRHP